MPARMQRTAQALIYNGFRLSRALPLSPRRRKSDEIAEVFVAALLVVQLMAGIFIYMYLGIESGFLIAAQELLRL